MIGMEEMQEILDTSARLVSAVSTDFHRYLREEIDWRGRLICIKGARGTGKTTLMLQRIREAFGIDGKAVYISLDDLWFSNHRVRDAVEYFHTHGYTHVFVDEVHHFGKDWALLVKNLYDQFPDLNFVYRRFSGGRHVAFQDWRQRQGLPAGQGCAEQLCRQR